MNKMIGVISKADWSKAPEGTTHILLADNTWYNASDLENVIFWAFGANKWMRSSCWYDKSYKFITKEEDLEMYKKEISCIEDLQTGMFVFMQGGHSAYVNIDDRGRIGFLFTNQHSDVNYTMQSAFDGLEYSPNKDISITHWGYSLAGERYPVVTSEADIKIKELEATIALAQKQLQEYKEMK